MIFLNDLVFELPLKNPVIIFSLVLFIILFAPILFNRIKVPHIIGLILAGVIVGPYGFNLLMRDSSIVLFGTVGLLYIMFLAGLEIDLSEFKKNRLKILLFGILTFIFPLAFGVLASYYILGFSFISSVLLASMFSTHTLISYPIASRYGLTRNRAVTLAIGGTMITDIFALLILAAIAGMTKEDVSNSFWITLGVSSLIFVGIVFFLFPLVIRWFFKKFDDPVSQYIFVLAIVFLSSFLAEVAGIEAIIGAFFSGLVLNRFIPHTSPLMNRIDFVGNALFIPFFLISVGMLVDVTVLVKGWGALKVAGVIVVVALTTKWIAAKLTQKLFRLLPEEGNMLFGLSSSHAAATLAIILVGYNIIIGETAEGEPIRLLNEDVLNGTILLILVSCAISSFAVERASRKLVLLNDDDPGDEKESDQRILISLADLEGAPDLVDLGLMLKPVKSNVDVYALHVISDDTGNNASDALGKKMMEKAMKQAVATDNHINPVYRYDTNISNGIIYTIKEYNITDIIIGLHKGANENDFLGPVTEKLVRRTFETTFIYKAVQPVNTLKRMVVAIPPMAELEPGFTHWLQSLLNLATEGGLGMVFYGDQVTLQQVKDRTVSFSGNVSMIEFNNWEDFLLFSGIVKANDLFVIITSRKNHVSYHAGLEKLPYYLSKYFKQVSYLIIYPRQLESGLRMEDVDYVDSGLADTIEEGVKVLNQPANILRNLFGKKKKK